MSNRPKYFFGDQRFQIQRRTQFRQNGTSAGFFFFTTQSSISLVLIIFFHPKRMMYDGIATPRNPQIETCVIYDKNNNQEVPNDALYH